jgi:hypothetical protein
MFKAPFPFPLVRQAHQPEGKAEDSIMTGQLVVFQLQRSKIFVERMDQRG